VGKVFNGLLLSRIRTPWFYFGFAGISGIGCFAGRTPVHGYCRAADETGDDVSPVRYGFWDHLNLGFWDCGGGGPG